jgi:AcrR family transcriptional regulator
MPKIVDKKEKRSRILESAIKVFAQKGVNNTKIADIAQAAGIGKGTVYEYYHSKEELITASFRHFMESMGGVIGRRLLHLRDPVDKLLAYFTAWGEIVDSESMGYIEVVLDFWAEGLRQEKTAMTINLAQMYAEYRATVKNLLDGCVSAGRIRPVDTQITASILLGTMDGLLVQWIADRDAFDIKLAIEMLPKIFISGLEGPA